MKTLGLTLLVICTVRVAGAITGGIVGWASSPQSTRSYRVGESLQTFGGFGDAQGVLLLVAELFILLWLGRHASRWTSPWTWTPRHHARTQSGPRSSSDSPPSGPSSCWSARSWPMMASHLSTRVEWGIYLSSGGFDLAYALASVGRPVALRHPTRSWQEPQGFRPGHMG